MAKSKKRLIVVFLFLAVASLLFFSIGGELLHSHLHHHKDQASHDNCFVSQLQAQLFIAFSTVSSTFLIKAGSYAAIYKTVEIKPYRIIPFSHAPPVIAA